MTRGFTQIDKRFEASQMEMSNRFEQIDKHFEQVENRFQQSGRRFN